METSEIALLVHVVAAIIWVGGAFAVQVLAWRTLARDDATEVARFAGDAEVIGMRVFMPASLVVLLAGAWLVYDGPWRVDDLWVMLALGLFALSFVTGAGFLGPESGRISRGMAERGAEDADVQRRIRRIMLVSRIELVWLLAIVALMVLKPTG